MNEKTIIALNQEIGQNGELSNQSSLDFALSMVKHKKSWLYELSYLLRSILVDHVFEDGNKRTALALIITYFDYKELNFDKDRIIFIVHTIAKKNVKSVTKIARLIKSVIIY